MSRTSHVLVPFALCAMGLSVLLSSGCRKKEEPKPEPPPSSPASYMKDPVFRKGLDDRRQAQNKVAAERAVYVAKLEELVEKTRKRLGGVTVTADGRDLLREELEKLPEWNDLQAKVKALNAKYEAGRSDLLKFTRARITPKKPISK